VAFWKRDKAAQTTPAWAYPLTPNQYNLFVRTVAVALDMSQIPGQREPNADGTLIVADRDGTPVTLGLQNLAQMVAGDKEADWSRIVRDHVAAFFADENPPQSSADGLASLRVRLWHPDYVEQATRTIYRDIAPGLVEALVIDLAHKVMGATEEQLGQWRVSPDEAWALAERNCRSEAVELVPQTGPDGIEVVFVVGESIYVSSHALWIDEHVSIDVMRGALLGVPTRHLVAVCPIHDLRVVKMVGAMYASNRRIFDEGPGSISPEVYWWRAGSFALIPIDASTKPAKVTPPASFVEMLNGLPEGPS
jgi:hypothetical protein